MGKTIIHCGPSGAGQLTKLVNQILVSMTLMAVSEAIIFAKKNGLDPEKTLDAVSGGAAASWQLSNLGPKMIAGDFRPGFMINLMQKDLRLLMQAAEDCNTSLPAASLVHQLFAAAQAAGHGKDGTQAMFTVLENWRPCSDPRLAPLWHDDRELPSLPLISRLSPARSRFRVLANFR